MFIWSHMAQSVLNDCICTFGQEIYTKEEEDEKKKVTEDSSTHQTSI